MEVVGRILFKARFQAVIAFLLLFLAVTKAANAKPDLVISGSVSVTPTTVKRGTTVKVGPITIKNQGTAALGRRPYIGYYLSTNPTITTSDTRLDYVTTGKLAAGASESLLAKTLTIPSSTSPRSYYIGVLADYNKKISESNENNNYKGEGRGLTRLMSGFMLNPYIN